GYRKPLTETVSFRREMNRFAEERLPDLTVLGIPEPIPENVDESVDTLGEPLTSFRIPGDQKVSELVGAGIALVPGLGFLAGAALGLIQPERPGQNNWPMVVIFGLTAILLFGLAAIVLF